LVVAVTFAAAVVALAAGVLLLRRAGGGGFDTPEGSEAFGVRHQLKHRWRSVRGRHWQIISTELQEPEDTDAREGNRGDCPVGMVQVSGAMKREPDPNPYSPNRIATMQLTTCVDWISKDYPERCRQFDRDKWIAIAAEIDSKPMSYCIDRFEYPNLAGQYPIIFVSWYEAVELCRGHDKRLCTEDEWTFACEGEEARPYPYGDGYRRDPEQCITDRPWVAYNERAMVPRDGDAAEAEMDRLWGGHASGAQPRCRSPFGVYDMTGNVDEWTRSVREGERPSILKGGYWGPVRTRCRPATRSHDQNHMFYQQGFRCCADVGMGGGAARDNQPDVGPLPPELR